MLPHPIHPTSVLRLLFGLTALLLVSGCKSKENEVEEEDRFFKNDPKRVEEAHTNRLQNDSTAFLRSQAAHPIPWQQWGPQVFEHAEAEQKPVFSLVVGGNYPGTRDLLEQMKGDAEILSALKENYICTLIDIHAHPELAQLSFFLASEIRRAVSFPTLVWFTCQRNPIAWLPLSVGELKSFGAVFANSHEMVMRVWKDDPRYVMSNSSSDSDARTTRIRQAFKEREEKKEPNYREVNELAGRELSALYDPTSRYLDGSGGLVPFPALQYVASLASEPATSLTLRKRLVEMSVGHLDLLLETAVNDPLEGGFFAARRTRGWQLPIFVKESATQLEAIIALSQVDSLTEPGRYLDSARAVLAFTEARFADERGTIGIYETPPSQEVSKDAYLLSREKLREFLPPGEFSVVEKCYGISGLGNIPIESDPQRIFFRLNSLSLVTRPEEAAADLGLSVEKAVDLLEAARQRLLVRRRELLDSDPDQVAMESTRLTGLNARFAAALAELGAASGDEKLIDKSRNLLKHLQDNHYSAKAGLMRIPAAEGQRGIPARGQDYALLLDALFTTYRSDLDPAHLVWADQLSQELIEKCLDDDGLLQEVPAVDRLLPTPFYHFAMIFGSSTWGVLAGPLKRLHQLTGSEKLAAALATIEAGLVDSLQRTSLLHTDYGLSSLVSQTDTVVCLEGPKESPELQALHKVLREPAHHGATVVHLAPSLPATFKLPEPAETTRAVVIRGGEQIGVAATGEDLRRLLVGPSTQE